MSGSAPPRSRPHARRSARSARSAVSPPRTPSHAEARRFYDAFGARQDRQGFYEEPALAERVEHLELDRARAIAELGCGAGRLAARILAERAPPDCRYLGGDLSATMVALARPRYSTSSA